MITAFIRTMPLERTRDDPRKFRTIGSTVAERLGVDPI
jgi:hypothetical protein